MKSEKSGFGGTGRVGGTDEPAEWAVQSATLLDLAYTAAIGDDRSPEALAWTQTQIDLAKELRLAYYAAAGREKVVKVTKAQRKRAAKAPLVVDRDEYVLDDKYDFDDGGFE